MIPFQVLQVAVPPRVWATTPNDRPLADLATDALGSARRILKGSNARRERLRYTQLTGYIEAVALELSRRAGVTLSGVRSLRWQGTPADVYLDLVERLGGWRGETDADRPAALTEPGRFRSFATWLRVLAANLHRAWLAFLPLSRAKLAADRIRFAWRDFRTACAGARSADELGAALKAVGGSVHPPGRAVSEQRRLFDRLTPNTLARMFPDLPPERHALFAAVAAGKADFFRAAEAAGGAVVEVVAAVSE